MCPLATSSLLQEYFECQDTHRSHVLGTLVRRYHAIGPLLIKVEGLVVSTNTGKSPRLHDYYAHWERRMFEALVKVSHTPFFPRTPLT